MPLSRTIRPSLASVCVLALAGCPAETPETWTAAGPVADGFTCNPLAPEWDCLFPYPSDFFRKPTPDARRPFTIELPAESKPTYVPPEGGDRVGFDFFEKDPADGFSVAAQIGLRVPAGVSTSNLVFHTADPAYGSGDIGDTLDIAKSPTLLLDAETGALQPHFAELDMRGEGPTDRALLLRPAKRLENGHRYIVVLKDLKDATGAALPQPTGFRAIVTKDTPDAKLDRIRRYYEAHVFPTLVKAGLDPATLTLAWDFTTQSWDDAAAEVLEIRRLAMEGLAADPPQVVIDDVKTLQPGDADYETMGRKIRGHFQAPLFTVVGKPDVNGQPVGPNDFPDDQAGARLYRDANGKVGRNGTTRVNFLLIIPRSVLDDPSKRPARLLQYGHGFFGGAGEIYGYASRFANEKGFVLMATDWAGMATADAAAVFAHIATDIPDVLSFAERTVQGMVNFISLSEAAKTTLGDAAALQVDGTPVFDRTKPPYYYGISQGHILGTTFVALSPHVEKAAFSVGGASFGLMMSRASPFEQFLSPIDEIVQGPANANSTRAVVLLQTALDRIDPITWAPHLNSDTFPGSPASRKVLLQNGIADTEVPNIATHLLVRTLGLPYLTPVPRSIWGIPEQAGPLDSAALEFDFALPIPDVYARLNDADNIVHEAVRRTPAAMEQLDTFFRPDGRIVNTCRDAQGTVTACHCSRDANDTCGTAE